MDVLNEAKEIMRKAGCEKAFAVYKMELYDIAEVQNCDGQNEKIELKKDIADLVPTIEQKLVVDENQPIECPLNSSMNKYLEFSLKDRSITPYNLENFEYDKIEEDIRPLLQKYNWSIKSKNDLDV